MDTIFTQNNVFIAHQRHRLISWFHISRSQDFKAKLQKSIKLAEAKEFPDVTFLINFNYFPVFSKKAMWMNSFCSLLQRRLQVARRTRNELRKIVFSIWVNETNQKLRGVL